MKHSLWDNRLILPIWMPCVKCGKIEFWTPEYFPYYLKNKGILRLYCKECANTASRNWIANNKEKTQQHDREYRKNNLNKVKATQKRWRENNPDKVQELKGKWEKENPDKVKEMNAKYRNSNKSKIKKGFDKWYAKNGESVRERERIHRVSPATFDLYVDRLTIEEGAKRGDDNELFVKCAYCGKYFQPTNGAVQTRISSLAGKTRGECRLYCSPGCKKACPIYGRVDFPKGFKKASSREVDPLIRQLCLKRDDYTCQRCGALITEAELHAHHIEGAVQQPMLANDVENTITLCKKCHKLVHSQEGCHYFDLRCKK
jgi:hypothetical protein